MKYLYSIIALCLTVTLTGCPQQATAAIYCYPNGVVTTCFTHDGRSFYTPTEKNVRNPNTIIVPQYHPYVPTWIYHDQQPRRQVPEQDFGECTLALGCIKNRR